VAGPWSADAFFETGLLTAADWGGAQWVARPSRAGEADRWTDCTAQVGFKVDTAALGFFQRASDVNNGYMWQVNVTEAQPALRPHRRDCGACTLLGSVNLGSFGFTNEQLRTGRPRGISFPCARCREGTGDDLRRCRDQARRHRAPRRRLPGGATYQYVVPPSAANADGKVRIRLQDVLGDYDPSIADVWSVALG
jgi:hypothetical protein